MTRTWLLPTFAALAAACGPSVSPAPAALEPGPVFASTGDAMEAGPLEVAARRLQRGEAEAPFETRIHAPATRGTYPLVMFQHGFLSDIDWYDELLAHVASHGFVVAAAQMYPSDGVPLGKPTAAEEALEAARVLAWAQRAAGAVMGVALDPRPPGLAGHSRGGKVIWLEVLTGGVAARGLAGVDPVDGRGGPFGGQLPALDGLVSNTPPALVIGAELGPVTTGSFGACAPALDGFQHFFDDTAAPAWLFVAPGHGHADMLDEETWRVDGLCPYGPDRASMRRLNAGLLALFFRATLQDDETSRARLDAPGVLPLVPVAQRK